MTTKMGRKSKKTFQRNPEVQRTIKSERDSGELNERHSDAQSAVFIKTEDPLEETYQRTEFYEGELENGNKLCN